MDATTSRAVKRLGGIAAVLQRLPLIAAEEYANGRLRAKPIVSRHFTAGNQQRYGWQPLSRAYFLSKSGGIVHHRGAAHHLSHSDRAEVSALKAKHSKTMKLYRNRKGADQEEIGDTASARKAQGAHHRLEMGALLDRLIGGRAGSKLDKAAEFHHPFSGGVAGVGAGTNLPMLVRSGRLRQAVTSRTHRIEHQGDVAVCVFANLPVYAIPLHQGTPNMPKRSPVEPNGEDRDEVVAVMQKQLDVAIGTGGDVPVEARSIPGQARFI